MHDQWEVFLSPHTDDETLAMAGAISRAHAEGRKTCVVLVTDNLPSSRLSELFKDVNNLTEVRREEFRRALCALKVDAVRFWEIPEKPMKVTPLTAQKEIYTKLMELHCDFEIAHVHTTVGFDDVHVAAGFGCVAHGLCASVVTQFAHDFSHISASLHGVYVYAKPKDKRQTCGGLHLRRRGMTNDQWDAKKRAMKAYYPDEHALGYGFASVPDLFKGAMSDAHEYVFEITRHAEVAV